MSNIKVSYLGNAPLEEQAVEYVERKGKGHPDTLIDGIVERASVELSKAYLEKTEQILHHNVDKGLIVGGESTATFGSGKITRPIEVIVAGRATKSLGNIAIPVDEIAMQAAKDYLRENTRFLGIESEVKFATRIQKGSADLNGVFKRAAGAPLANDTSFGIGFAPFTETEKLAIETERYLNSMAYKKSMPMVGEDVKVMSIREENSITLTIAIAFVAKFVKSMDDYVSYKERIMEDVLKLSKKYTKRNVSVAINNGDSHSDNDVYLTKSGLSCEAGDDGSVGRGNRVNGIITPFRPMTLEAAWGKNPINHVGKIYSVVSNEIASEVVMQYPEVKECTVYMVSQIGRPISDPKHVNLELVLEDRKRFGAVMGKAHGIAEEMLGNLPNFARELIEGKHVVLA